MSDTKVLRKNGDKVSRSSKRQLSVVKALIQSQILSSKSHDRQDANFAIVSKQISSLVSRDVVVSEQMSSLGSAVGVNSADIGVNRKDIAVNSTDIAKLKQMSKESEGVCVDSVRNKVLSRIPGLFNMTSGITPWVPVEFQGEDGKEHKLVVFCVPMFVSYFTRESGLGIDPNEVKSIIGSPSNFPRYQIKRVDLPKIILKTPFRPYALGKAENPNSLTKNEERFIFVSWGEFKDFLNKRSPVSLAVVPMTKFPERVAQRYAFRCRFEGTSTGRISELGGLELTKEEKMFVPAMGVQWWKDLLTPIVMECQEIVVGSATVPYDVLGFDQTVVKDNQKREAALVKKRARKNRANKINKRARMEEYSGIESLD